MQKPWIVMYSKGRSVRSAGSPASKKGKSETRAFATEAEARAFVDGQERHSCRLVLSLAEPG
jgi:hypothetical protein